MGNSAAKKAKPGKYSDFLAQLDKVRKDHPDNLCAKFLTSKIFLSYKPEQQEFLYRCCRSGVENPDSSLGCYAMRPDDYKVFSSFFDPLIRSYHKADAKSKHVSDWDISSVGEGGVLDVTKLGLSELSMRVRVGRNLKTFNLPGMMDKAERIKFEKSMLKAFEKLIAMPEFGGRVYSLTPEFGAGEANPNLISEPEYQKLVDDHVMFKDMSADPYLKSAGIANDWPYGRGCYMSADGQVIVWMGEEDQLRIMCMKKGTKLNEVFERLNSVLQTIEKIPGMEFAWDENFGYVTSCPSNLGTGMRASVHVKVPNLTADGTDKKAKQICKPLGLSVRGLGGEHTPIGKDGTIDLSPSARLFIRERDIIAKLYEGIRQLMEEEGKLAPKKVEEAKPEPAKVEAAAEAKPEPVVEVKPEPVAEPKVEPPAEPKAEPVVEAKPAVVDEAQAEPPKTLDPKMDLIMNESLAKNEYPADLMAKYKGEKKCSLMAKVMTPEMFEKYKNHKTATAGWTIARAINTGVMHPSSFVGCHAGDHESYHDYSEFFYPVIEQYHVGFKVGESKQRVDLDPSHIGVELTDLAKTKIITTRIRAARNLEGHPLNPGGTKESRLGIQEILGKAFEMLPEDLKGQFFLHATMTKEEQQKLIDDHFLFRGADAMQAASGYHQFWPAGRGIFVNPTKTFVVWVNEGDHIRIISMQEGGDVKEVFTRLGRAISALEQGIRTVTSQDGKVFMEDEKLGTISCCPSNLGGGLRAGVHIRIPKLIEKIGFDKIDELARERFCQARGSSGEHSEVIDRIDVSNWRRLGFSEAELVTDMINCVNFFAEEEAKLEQEGA